MDLDDDLDLGESAPGRYVDIELGPQEEVTIDLDNLEDDPKDILDLLREANSSVWKWIRFANEYWRKGLHSAAEEICQAAIEASSNGSTTGLWPIHTFRAILQLEYARKTPKRILTGARKDIVHDGKTKDTFYDEAARLLNKAEEGREEASAEVDAFQTLRLLTRAIYIMSKRGQGWIEAANQGFDNVLALNPNNIPALLGKARVYYAKREFPIAMQHFQRVLSLSPRCRPDPRIGIGLCLWMMGSHEKARAAWERSLEVNPNDWAGHVILGLDEMNRSREPKRPDEERATAYTSGSRHIEKAFRANNKNAAAANVLSEFFLRKGDTNNSLKLAERTLQFADTAMLTTEGHLRVARVSHVEGSASLATKHYQEALNSHPKHVLASLGLAQMQLLLSETAAAIHTLNSLMQPPSAPPCLEANIMLASMRANPRPGVSSSEFAQDKTRARDMFEQIIKYMESQEPQASESRVSRSVRNLSEDMEMHLEIARLWQNDSTERMARALKEALRISQSLGISDCRIVNNLASLKHMEGELRVARSMYEDALGIASSANVSNQEDNPTTILYNLARVYEEQDEIDMANEAYDKLLQRHPEYVDARIRQAQLLKEVNQINEAHLVLKQALASQSHNLNLRAFYTYFLLQTNQSRFAKDFVFATLKDHDKHDLYSLCSAGLIMYLQAREDRNGSPEGLKARRRNFERSIEFYEKALALDPSCAIAAQGLAIVTAEDIIGTFNAQNSLPDVSQKAKQAREALDVFTKVRETIVDGSVYANMGHCYFARDEFDRAIESYETASKKFYKQQNVPVLLCLSRTNYAKATKDQSYPHMVNALNYAQRALYLAPYDKAILYNVAMIEQKAAETLFALDPSKRSLSELRKGIEHAEHAQSLFSSLASDKADPLPYNRDMADQRRKYGESLLRKADDHIALQEAHEAEVKERLHTARLKRQEEKDRTETLERERVEQLRRDAEKLMEDRKKARDEAMAWTAAAKAESDDEREKKQIKKSSKKPKNEAESGDEAEVDGEVKKKRKGKLRKGESAVSVEPPAEEDEALFSGDGDDQPKKRIPKKRVVRDDDEEDALTGPRKKLIKSKEMISDSDDMMD